MGNLLFLAGEDGSEHETGQTSTASVRSTLFLGLGDTSRQGMGMVW